MIALTTSLLMWLEASLDVGGEWFLMWQSKMWNGQEEAFRMFTIVGVVFNESVRQLGGRRGQNRPDLLE